MTTHKQDEEIKMQGDKEKSSSSAQDREWLYDRTKVTITVQEVANKLHQDMYQERSEHLAIHSCPCHVLARWYLGVDEKPRMYWPDGKGGNAWDKKQPTSASSGDNDAIQPCPASPSK